MMNDMNLARTDNKNKHNKVGFILKTAILMWGVFTISAFAESKPTSVDGVNVGQNARQVKSAAQYQSAPMVKHQQKRLASKPLTEMAKIIQPISPSRKNKMQASGKPVPGDGSDYIVPNNRFPFKITPKQRGLTEQKDPALQSKAPIKSIPAPIISFDGIPNIMAAVPPDTNGDVGPNHYVQTVNTALAVWDKQGNEILAPVAINSLWSGLGGLCESTNRGDPIVLYDAMADRWLISQFAFNDSMTDNRQCIAISQTPDPTGGYYIYDFQFSATLFNDYPKFGVWQDGYYMSVNQFNPDFAGVGVVVYEREAMLVGGSARQIKFDLGSRFPTLFSILPSDHDGIFPAPVGSPNYFFAIQDDEFHDSTLDQVNIYEFLVDWEIPANSSFELAAELPVAKMDLNIETSEIVQPNRVTLDSLSGFAMYRLAYRNLGDRGALVVNHSVDANGAGQAGIRWYEINIDNSTGDISLAQQGTFAPDDGVDRWMGSAAMDASGNIAVGYSATSESIHPSVYYAGRLAADPAGELTQGEGVIVAGGGSQGVVENSRWADYSMLGVDPFDDCTFWYTTEYYQVANNETLDWSTRIGSFKFPSCDAPLTGYISGIVTDQTTGLPVANVRVNAGARTTQTDTDGAYSLRLPVETYSLTFGSYWYQTQTISDIPVTQDQTSTKNVSLILAPTANVNGVVSDASGQGWPLYSLIKVDIPNATDLEIYSNPFTGQYSVSLVEGIAVPVTFISQVEGYQSTSMTMSPIASSPSTTNLNVGLEIDSSSCSAPGYLKLGYSENFEGEFLARGWTSVDNNSSGFRWGSTADGRPNITGGTGDAALMDSDAAGEVAIDTSLESPIFNVAELASTNLNYLANFQTFSAGDNFDLDISIDGGDWRNLLAWTGNHGAFAGPGEAVEIDLASQMLDATQLQLRWRYYNANFEWFAMVDEVRLGAQCEMIPGGSIIAGYITDSNTVAAINGASIESGLTDGSKIVFSKSTAGDDNVNDGLYFTFADAQTDELLVTAGQYGAIAQPVTVQAGSLVRVDVALPAAVIEVLPNPLEFNLMLGRTKTENIDITNLGGIAASYRITELNSTTQQQTLASKGRFDVGMRYSGPKANIKRNAGHIRDYRPPVIKSLAAGDVSQSINLSSINAAFGVALDQARDKLWFGSSSESGSAGDQKLYSYDLSGTLSGDNIDLSSIINTTNGYLADLAFNSRTGMLWISEIDDQNCIHEINPATMALTGSSICPAGISSGQHGLAYDPITDTFLSGSWDDSLIHRFTTSGELLSSFNTGLAIAGLAFNPTTNHLYVSVNAKAPEFDLVVLDLIDYASVGGFNVMADPGDGNLQDVMGDLAQGGLSIDCDGSLWMVEMNKLLAFKIDTDAEAACSWSDVSWMAVAKSGDLEPQQSEVVGINMNTVDLALGSYQAQLLVENNSPYGNQTIPVTMNVVESNSGTVQFSASSLDANEEQTYTLSVQRVDGNDFAISVDYTTVNGSAVAGTNYTPSSGTLNWEDFDAEAKTIQVTILTVNQNSDFSVILSNPEGGATLGDNTELSINVKDKPKGSGSLGLILLSLLFLGFYARVANPKKIKRH